MEIRREKYLSRLMALRFNGSAKIVTGVRRCGKSYLLFNLFRSRLLAEGVPEESIIAIALDSLENEHLCEVHALYSEILSRLEDGVPSYVIIDEIQLAQGFEKLVNSLMRRKDVDVYITGSNSKFLSSDIITEFRGRGTEVRVRPLSFSEYLEASDADERAAWRDYLTYGGLPESVFKSEREKASYLRNLADVVYVRDITERHAIMSPDVLDSIFSLLSSSIGSLTNPRRISNTVNSCGGKADVKTVTDYIGYLEDSFLFEESERFDLRGNRYIDTPKKYYSVDLGLRNAKLGFRQNEYSHLMENAIYNELRSRGFDVDVGVIAVREYVGDKRESRQFEIDFVASSGGARYYIQSAYHIDDLDKREQEIRPFLKLNDGFRKIVITGDDVPVHIDEKGIVFINVIDFMKDPESLSKV